MEGLTRLNAWVGGLIKGLEMESVDRHRAALNICFIYPGEASLREADLLSFRDGYSAASSSSSSDSDLWMYIHLDFLGGMMWVLSHTLSSSKLNISTYLMIESSNFDSWSSYDDWECCE